MNIIRFKLLRKDTSAIIEKVDGAINGTIHTDIIKELYIEVVKMIGRIEERTKDLKRDSNVHKDYIEIIEKLNKRRMKLEDIWEYHMKTQDSLENTIYIIQPIKLGDKVHS